MNNSTKLNSIVKLGKNKVGPGNRTFIIAEAGLNHNGDINIAKQLINNAVLCKCDAIKFQTFESNTRVSSKVKSVNYSEKADGLREDINQMFNRLRSIIHFIKKYSHMQERKKYLFFVLHLILRVSTYLKN